MPQLTTDLVAQRSGTVTIANGETTSTAFDARGFANFGLIMPAAFTGTSMTFQVSHDNTTFQALTTTTGSTVSITVAAAKSYALPVQLAAWRYFKVVSGSAEGDDRTLTIMASAANPAGTTTVTVAELIVDTVTVDELTPGTGSANLGKAEDAAHTTGDTGVLALAVRNANAATTFTSANGDYSAIAVDSVGAVYTRVLNNDPVTILSSAARTATNSSADQTNHTGRGLLVAINVTAVTATPSITVSIENKETIGDTYTAVLTSAAITGTGTTWLKLYPGIAAAANVAASDLLAHTYRITVTHADADSITYSVQAQVIA